MKAEGARKFQDLIVRQKTHNPVLSVYRASGNLPKSESLGLSSQF